MKVEKVRTTVRVVRRNGIRVFGLMMLLLISGTILTHQTFGQNDSPPIAPSDFVVASDGGNALMLIWDDNSDNEDNFIVERKIGTKGTFSTFATLPADTSKWRDDNTANLYNTTISVSAKYFTFAQLGQTHHFSKKAVLMQKALFIGFIIQIRKFR